MSHTAPPPDLENRLAPGAALAIRAAIRLAKGREVCFVGTIDERGMIASVRVAARGDAGKVLALDDFAEPGQMLIHNHPSGWLEPSSADFEIAARVHEMGIGFAIVDNDATDLYVVLEVPKRRELVALDPESVSRDLGPDGPVARAHAAYEDRPSQRALASTIAQLYNDGGVGLLEAGTGVGKSMGYLIPALRWAAANGERTIVSTNTINLQEQLVRKDLPFLAKVLDDQPVRFALLKGWRNYLCRFRLEQARNSGAALFEDGMREELDTIARWAERTIEGSLSDLPVAPRPEVWDEVSAEPDVCQRARCPAYDKCFLFKARREAAEADVIVVNHHLLLSDVAVRRASHNWEDSAVLPPYRRLVVDEGHHLEDAAATHLGSTVTRRSLVRLFNRLDRKGKGLLNALIVRLTVSKDLLSTASLDLVHARLAPAVEAARDKSALLFDLLELFVQDSGQAVVRLTDEFANDGIWDAGLRVAFEDTLDQIRLLGEGLQLVRERMESGGRIEDAMVPLLNEMRAVTKRLEAAGDGLRAALAPVPGAPTVRWAEVKGRDRIVAVSSVPLDLAPILRQDLFDRTATTVVTSATLAADAKFDFVASRLGLGGASVASPRLHRGQAGDVDALEPTTAIFPSPFAYRRQALLVVPTDVPAPNVNADSHFQALTRVVLDVAERSDGGLFVLFTSHRDVRMMASELRSRGCDRRWPLLVHGEEPRDHLLARFREAGGAILLGTASFWEGVDVPGDALRGLVIAKLPFRVPTEPVTAAHCEAITARGGDPFFEYMLPHASLRLKQGFGRLIRTGTDRGVVVIADPRIATKAYGRGMLEALPPARRLVGRWEELKLQVGAFYGL
jgi:ATP-dependent DNA helicase DinG